MIRPDFPSRTHYIRKKKNFILSLVNQGDSDTLSMLRHGTRSIASLTFLPLILDSPSNAFSHSSSNFQTICAIQATEKLTGQNVLKLLGVSLKSEVQEQKYVVTEIANILSETTGKKISAQQVVETFT